MSEGTVVGFAGSFSQPSKTRNLVDHLVQGIAGRADLSPFVFDIDALGPSFAAARWPKQLDTVAGGLLQRVVEADVLVVGSPTYKGSYTGLFKHFFDLIDPAALRGKPVLLTATGGGERHALLIEHQLRPLFAFFGALVLPTSIYAIETDFADGQLAAERVLQRASLAIDEAVRLLPAKV